MDWICWKVETGLVVECFESGRRKEFKDWNDRARRRGGEMK